MTNPHRPGARPGAPRPAAARSVAAKRDAAKPNYSTVTTTGVEPTVAAALSYILGLITGIVFLILEKDNRYVRFHAAQSIVVSVFIVIASIAVSMISRGIAYVPMIGWTVVLMLTMGLAVATFVLWLLLMWRAYSGDEWELPVAGEMARRIM